MSARSSPRANRVSVLLAVVQAKVCLELLYMGSSDRALVVMLSENTGDPVQRGKLWVSQCPPRKLGAVRKHHAMAARLSDKNVISTGRVVIVSQGHEPACTPNMPLPETNLVGTVRRRTSTILPSIIRLGYSSVRTMFSVTASRPSHQVQL